MSTATKTFITGTHRVRHPDHTWSLIRPRFAEFGVTRVNEVTGLDILGVPVAVAVRPLGKTLSVSQGKGLTGRLAKVSAAMEAIELWHAENIRPPLAHRRTPAGALTLPYALSCMVPDSGLVTETTPLDWINANGLRSGTAVAVPADLTSFPSAYTRPWQPSGLAWTSNGLASGNCWEEACLHALYEIIERDAVAFPQAPLPVPIDAVTVADDACADLIDRFRRAGAQLELFYLPSRFGVPCFAATVWSLDFPVLGLGWGAHSTAGIALSRAITEAAQSRLSAISGARDDVPPLYASVRAGLARVPKPADGLESWSSIAGEAPPVFTDVAAELRWLVESADAVVGCEPLVVDLAVDRDISVVMAFVPGAYASSTANVPRR